MCAYVVGENVISLARMSIWFFVIDSKINSLSVDIIIVLAFADSVRTASDEAISEDPQVQSIHHY